MTLHQDQEMVYLYVTRMQVCSWDTIAITVTHNGLDCSGFKPCERAVFDTHQVCLKGPPSLLYNGYWFSFLGERSQGMALSTHPHLVPD